MNEVQEELNTTEVRVLGTLMEKARTTPDIYPLTLNSLVNACNQKTSRDPVTDYDEDEVMDALDSLRDKGLVMRVDMAGSRTAKFRENAADKWQLERQEYALLATLFLRGPQTPGQLRQRCERLYPFAEVGQVAEWLDRMQHREEQPERLITPLAREPGTKEIRYAQVMGPLPTGEEPGTEPAGQAEPSGAAATEKGSTLREKVLELEKRVAALEEILHELTS